MVAIPVWKIIAGKPLANLGVSRLGGPFKVKGISLKLEGRAWISYNNESCKTSESREKDETSHKM